jgi:hypothetical protein
MPLEMFAAWVIVLATREPDRLAGKRIVWLPIVKVSLETAAHTDSVVGCHRHIALIEESMQIRPEQEAIVDSVLPLSRYRRMCAAWSTGNAFSPVIAHRR